MTSSAGPEQAVAHSVSATGTGRRGRMAVALAQLAPRLGAVAANLERHLQLIDDARSRGADLIVFPELSLTGYFLKDLIADVAVHIDDDVIGVLCDACRDIECVVGCVLESDDMRFYNASLYVSHGEVVAVHRKVYLPTYGLFDEARYFAQGDRFRSFEMPGRTAGSRRHWRAGMLLCEDMWHPSAVGVLARQGVELFICPSASPGRGVGRGQALGTARSYDSMTRTYAQLYASYLIYVNRVGYEDGIAFWGGSRVVSPEGAVIGAPADRSEQLLIHHLDLAAVRRARVANPMLRDERHDITDAEIDRLRRARD